MGQWHEFVANKWLDAVTGRTTYTAEAGIWVKLHVGDPGSAGTANPATETDRMPVTFGSAASDGAISNTVAVEWDPIAATGTEVITHASLWNDLTAGNFLGSDALSASASVENGDVFRIPVGDIDLTVASVLLT